jgi:dipeptidyl aminopeptidase/acylaminoacyl peptidase
MVRAGHRRERVASWRLAARGTAGALVAVVLVVVSPAVAAAKPKPKKGPSTVTSTVTFVDPARQRTLVTTVIAPTPGKQVVALPLLVFVHGYDQNPSDYQQLLTAWAGAGYVVVAPAFPGTAHGAATLDASDYRNEPTDVTFVISQVLAQSATPGGPLSGRVDPTRIGIAGHSIGAEVVLGMLNSCCRDTRVRAAVSLAGSLQYNPGVPAFPLAGYFTPPPVPLLLVHGDADTMNPYNRSVTAYAAATPPKFFLTIIGGDHRTPYESKPATDPSARGVIAVTTDFLDAYVKGDTRAAARLSRDGSVPNVATLQAAAG